MIRVLERVRNRRRQAVLVSVFAIALLAALFNPGAQAVHDTGKFQLDGNAQVSLNSTPSASEDWDLICKANPGTCTFADDYDTSGLGTSTATASSHDFDGAQNATIFTGGGSKDPEDLSAWAWKNESGGLPDKDNLQHGFAARYSLPVDPDDPNDPNDTVCLSNTSFCDLLYFGMDRFDNSGDAQLGFWFFRNTIDFGTQKVGGGTSFDGVHAVGDLLILADFSNGGTVATINIYKWVGTGGDTNNTLDLLDGGTAARCGGTGADAFCGIVNPANGTTAPWVFTDKGGNSSYLNGEFFEGGVNLSDPDINLAGTCFSSFLVESRSSTSPTATLKDFILGGLGGCESSIDTTQSWTPNDSARITVTGVSSWTGTVTFRLYTGSTCSGTLLYTSDELSVNQSDFTVSTTESTTQPDPITTPGTTDYSWKVNFASPTTGVPAEESCVEVSTLTVDNDNTTS